MKIEKTAFEDVLLITPENFEDHRGSFSESFRYDKIKHFIKHEIFFCQDNISHSKKGVIRGLHYQVGKFSQSKLISVIQGEILDVVVDIRKGSPTFGKHGSFNLNCKNRKQLFMPRGYAHGYITLSEKSTVCYKVDNYYRKDCERSIAFDDSRLKIDWILPKSEWILSEKDLNNPNLDEALLFDFKSSFYD